MYRKLILAGVACFALSTAAYAGNSANVVQLGGQYNYSQVTQVGTSNWASTTQFGKHNTSLNSQLAAFGNTSLVSQTSTSLHHGSNAASNAQATLVGGNISAIGQSGSLNNTAAVGQSVAFGGFNINAISQLP